MLNDQPPCQCCSTIRDYIATHYDPDGLLDGSEDPATLIDHFDEICDALGDDAGCEINSADMAAYLAEIRERSAAEVR